jgi:hypothetical protein
VGEGSNFSLKNTRTDREAKRGGEMGKTSKKKPKEERNISLLCWYQENLTQRERRVSNKNSKK